MIAMYYIYSFFYGILKVLAALGLVDEDSDLMVSVKEGMSRYADY